MGWREFERECMEFLEEEFTYANLQFIWQGKSDPTKSDIEVITPSRKDFYIEVKLREAQSGQFVLIPNEVSRKFEYSEKNKTELNQYSQEIIDSMNRDFDMYCAAGTTGREIKPFRGSTLCNWIKSLYEEKCVKYVMSKGENYVILPLEKIGDYFEVSALYRVKKSGSSSTPKKYRSLLMDLFMKDYGVEKREFYVDENKFGIRTSVDLSGKEISIKPNRFIISKADQGSFEIRKLSDTANANVIFSIKLIKEQDDADLLLFRKEISK